MSDRIILEKRARVLRAGIEKSRRLRKRVENTVQKIVARYSIGEISHKQYYEKIEEIFGERTPEQWVKYYDDYILACEARLNICNKRLKKIRRLSKIKVALPLILVFGILFIGLFYFQSDLTGLVVEGDISEGEETQTDDDGVNEIGGLDEDIVDESEDDGDAEGVVEEEIIVEEEEDGIEETATGGSGDDVQNEEGDSSEEEITEDEIEDDEVIVDEPEVEDEIVNETVEEIPEVNETESEVNVTEKIEVEENVTGEETVEEEIPEVNVTIVLNESEINVSTLQYKAIINRPVRWVKKIDVVEFGGNLTLELPIEAENISIHTGREVDEVIKEIEEYENVIENVDRGDIVSGRISGNVVRDIEEGRGLLRILMDWLRGFTITGNVVKEDEIKDKIKDKGDKKEVDLNEVVSGEGEIAVEYYTEGPSAVEEETFRGKIVTVSGSDDLNLTNILAYAEIPERYDVGGEDRIKIYWREQGEYVNFTALDIDGNGKLDYVEWIVPHLSNQTFDIILITEAEHLDSDRNFISDIFEEVRELDGNWSEEIPDGDYVRVVFERNLTSDRDITIWPRTVSGTPRIEVYEVNGTSLVAEFTSLNDNEYNKVYLTNLISESQDTFDLLIKDGSIEIDYIVDPTQEFFEDCLGITDWDVSAGWSSVLGQCKDAQTKGAIHTMTTGSNGPIDLSGETSANLSFYWDIDGLDEGSDYLKAFANSTASGTFVEVFDVGSGTASGTAVVALEDFITLDSGVNLRFSCLNNQGNEVCIVDDINVTSYVTADTSFPTFSDFGQDTINNSVYANGASYLFNVSVSDSNGTAGLTFDGVNYSTVDDGSIFNSTISDLEAGNFSYFWWAYGSGASTNYNETNVRFYTVAQAIPEGSITNSTDLTVSYPSEITIGLSESNAGDDDLSYLIYRDGVSKGTGETITLGVGTFEYVLNTTGGQNFTFNVSMDAETFTVNEGNSAVNLTFFDNKTDSNITIETGSSVLINGTMISGDATGRLVLYNNGTAINNGTNEVRNTTTFSDIGLFNITVVYFDSANYSVSSKTHYVNVTPVPNVAPEIYFVGEIPDTDPTENNFTTIEVNFSVVDTDGYEKINGSSILANVTRFGEPVRANNSCVQTDGSGNFANYSCSIEMQYFDENGDWNISVRILDNSSSQSQNLSGFFQYNLLTSFIINPTNFNFDVNIGDTNITSTDDPINLSNTGNDELLNISVNAIDLFGVDDSTYFIGVANISVSNSTGGSVECDTSGSRNASVLVNGSDTQVGNAALRRGNYSAGTDGNEKLFFCLRTLPSGLKSQEYSSTTAGGWLIKIALALLVVGEGVRRRKKKVIGEVSIPITIFSKKLGMLESVVKYLKENLEFSLIEIAELLERDQRTIWNVYNKGKEKMKGKMKIGKADEWIPVSILGDRRLTVMEIVVAYLKERGNKNSEIARLIDRDPRNVWDVRKRREIKVENVESGISIPDYVFDRKLGMLESVVKYMKENLEMRYSDIAKMLGRDQRTVWTAYKKASDKVKGKIKMRKSLVWIPSSVIRERGRSVLENVIGYLKSEGLKNVEVSRIIKRDARNVSRIYLERVSKEEI